MFNKIMNYLFTHECRYWTIKRILESCPIGGMAHYRYERTEYEFCIDCGKKKA